METSLTWLGKLVGSPTDADWQPLMDVYAPLVRSWAARAGVPMGDTQDLVQEVLLVVVRRIGEFEHQHAGAFRAWLRAILANHLKKYFRDHAKAPCAIDLEALEDGQSGISQKIDREHDAHIVRETMKRIESDFEPLTWMAFRRQMLDEVKPAIVAAELGISLNAVIKAKSRVLKRFREELKMILD